MKEKLVKTLIERKLTISCCESLSAGLCMATLASVPGASQVLKGGFVTYQTQMKEDLVHVDKKIIEQYGVVSKECAHDMALHTKELTQSDIALSFTGNAGPSAMENKPAGLVYYALAYKDRVDVFEFQLKMERNQLRETIVDLMIERVIALLEME